jgi:NAD(P)-dependent dehydrogenase (short-subunit alcohol dehydrogenase family)
MAALDGQTVLITGASRGIGAAAARSFAAAGAQVALVARSGDEIGALADEIGPAARAYACDVSDFAALAAAVQQAESDLGPVGVLINNAGVISPIGRIAEIDPAAWARVIDINLTGVFNGMRAVLPGMVARGGGTILTVSSGAAHNPLEGWSHYCASKAGAAMLTRALDLEYRAAGIRAMGLSPGTVATEMQVEIKASGLNPVSQLDFSVHIPADWPARALVWMCSEDAAEFTGTEISLRDEAIRRRVGLI